MSRNNVSSILLSVFVGIILVVRLANCQFPQFFGQQQQQWYPPQQQWQQPVFVQQQQPWHHHHHHEDDHHHHDDHHHDHHHHFAHHQHYPPIRNNNGNGNDANQQTVVIPYRQEQFSPLGGGADFAEASATAGNSSPAEFQEQLPELFKPPAFSDQQTVEHQQQHQQKASNANGAFLTQKQHQQQQVAAVGNTRPAGAVPAERHQTNGTRARVITTTGVRLPANRGPISNNNNGNKFGISNNGNLNNVQPRKQLLLLTTTTATITTAAATAARAKAKSETKRPPAAAAAFPPSTSPKHVAPPAQQAVPAKQPSTIVKDFDLPPPPPPSRFLPDAEKLRIAELLRQKMQPNFRHDVDNEGIIHQFDGPSSSTTTEATATTATTTTTTTSTLVRLAGTGTTATAVPIRKKNFDVLNKKILTALFLNTDKCPSENGLDLFTCAAQDSDHTDCCKTKRVQRTSAGNKCLAFCNLSPEAPRVQADASYLPCWSVLNEIKNCFREKLTAENLAHL